jgi:Tfp pilus assembly protein PilX
MLGKRSPFRAKRRQHGVVLVLALIVLVALTLAALAMTRSVFTSNMIAGNLAFQQATTNSADAGVEAAIAWLEANNGQTTSSTATTCASGSGSTVLACDQTARGYVSVRQDPTAGQTWDNFWTSSIIANSYNYTLPSADAAGNTVSYVIQRMCNSRNMDASNTSNDCSASPSSTGGTCAGGSSCDAQRVNLYSVSQIYYRITVQVQGPRNTKSYVQAMVAM